MTGKRRFAFAILMLALTGLFIGLGVWQVERLGEKKALIARVAARMDAAPAELPPPAEWGVLDPALLDYAPLRVTGRYVPRHTVTVFTSLGDARGPYGGPGFWVITPFALESGGTVFVNRGFVPQDRRADFVNGQGVDEQPLTLTGIARQPEEPGSFTPAADPGDRIDYVRDPDRLWRLTDPALAPFAPVTLDLPAGQAGTLPQGGETVVEFPNNHLGYAMTWFGFALLTPMLLIFWLRRNRRSEPA